MRGSSIIIIIRTSGVYIILNIKTRNYELETIVLSSTFIRPVMCTALFPTYPQPLYNDGEGGLGGEGEGVNFCSRHSYFLRHPTVIYSDCPSRLPTSPPHSIPYANTE